MSAIVIATEQTEFEALTFQILSDGRKVLVDSEPYACHYYPFITEHPLFRQEKERAQRMGWSIAKIDAHLYNLSRDWDSVAAQGFDSGLRVARRRRLESAVKAMENY